jgi:hypothetical protein
LGSPLRSVKLPARRKNPAPHYDHQFLGRYASIDQPLGTACAAEPLLTLAGYYVGREFQFNGVRAVWIASQGQIKFYGDDGQVLRMLDLGQMDGKRAA